MNIGDLGATFCAVRFRIDFWTDFESKRAPKGMHLGSQNGAKIDPQTRQNRSQFSKAKKTLLKTVLGASWSHLEPILGPVLGHFFDFGRGFTVVS